MKTNNQLVKYKNNPIRKLFSNLLAKFKGNFNNSNPWDNDIENKINEFFTNELTQKETKTLLKELLSRNHNLLETLDIRMLNKDIVNLFGKANLERIITNESLQSDILELSPEQLQIYHYILNYHLADFNERIANLNIYPCQNITLNELKNLDEKDSLKAISIILSNSNFTLSSLSELNSFYEKRKQMCKQIIDNPKNIEIEYKKEFSSNNEITYFPFELLYEMQDLSDLDRTKYAIIEAKYGMNLEKAKILCNAFGKDIDKIEQSEDTRVIQELKSILQENDIDTLKQIDLSENYANYEGTINIVPNLRNAYLHQYQETLYHLNNEDYIGTQSVKTKGKKTDIKIYNVLGKNNDRANFNMIITSLGGIYSYNHDYTDLKSDWNRATKNHTISCSYIGNGFLGVVDENYLLAFSDIKENELLRASNQDLAGADASCNIEDNLDVFLTPENEIASSKIYNELLVERKIQKDGKLVNRKPTYAVFIAKTIDDIKDDKNDRWQETKRMAAELDIPIAVIDGTQCTKLEFEKVQEMIKLVKEEKRMDLIPEIIHKIENNRAAQSGILKNVRNEIFSNEKIKQCLEEIIGTIITSDTNTFNQGIEEFAKVTKTIKGFYQKNEQYTEKCKTYDYDAYLERLKVLFSSRNGLNEEQEVNKKEISNQLEYDSKGMFQQE